MSMRLGLGVDVVVIIIILGWTCEGAAGRNDCLPVFYTDQWAVRIEGGEDEARQIASRHGFQYVGKILEDYFLYRHRKVSKRSTEPTLKFEDVLAQETHVKWLQQQVAKKRVKRDANQLPSFNDPRWPRMWYLNRGIGLDMNVVPVWKRGYTGKGVVVSILDDGLEKDHPDLRKNYDAKGSYDINDRDNDPQPRYDYTNENRHGTRCAGEVAAESNNGICGVGVAYNAGIGGIRMLDGDVTDAVEAQSLSHNSNHIDIYSASWGPDDNGKTVDGPGPLTWKAFQEGVSKGRHGLGSIFVWASGNGGQHEDNCNCDGYTNSIYTLSISSATENGLVPWYSEACASTLASTYSSGSGGERQIVTTDLRNGCTETHTGTSASAPLAAGLCALVLQANPLLSWRDLQHIVVLSATQANLHTRDWTTNSVGRKVSHHFGYGLMDVNAMVNLAENWTSVPTQHRCEINKPIISRGLIVNSEMNLTLENNGCLGSTNEVRYLEHVQSIISLSTSRRGELEIFLTSPGGTRSRLLGRRLRDMSIEGFNNWAFMTTHSWGEKAEGPWRLEIKNGASVFFQAKLTRWSLVLYGTDREPYGKKLSASESPFSTKSLFNSTRQHLKSEEDSSHPTPPVDPMKSWSAADGETPPDYPINKSAVRSKNNFNGDGYSNALDNSQILPESTWISSSSSSSSFSFNHRWRSVHLPIVCLIWFLSSVLSTPIVGCQVT